MDSLLADDADASIASERLPCLRGVLNCLLSSISLVSIAYPPGGCDKLNRRIALGSFLAGTLASRSPVLSLTCPLATSRSPRQKTLTDIVVLQQAASPASVTMSASPESSPANGHVSPVATSVAVQLLDPEPSDSDLSDVQAPDVASPSSDSANNFDSTARDGRADDFDGASSPSDNGASDDADFDEVVDSPASPRSNGPAEGAVSASDDSRTASKRKAGGSLEEDYMRENPELYGLRRSVSSSTGPIQVAVLTTTHHSPVHNSAR